MGRRVFLIGGGGHARVVLDALLLSGANVAGILDPGLKNGEQIFGVSVVGGDDVLGQFATTEVLLVNGLGANPSVRNRKKLFESLKERGFSFAAVRHPSAVIGSECAMAESAQVMAGTVLQNRARIGENAVINTGATVDHDCVIGAHAFVAPGVVVTGGVLVGESAFVGAGVVVLPAVEIGANAVIGAGAVVTKNVPQGWIVAGCPAVKIGMNKQ